MPANVVKSSADEEKWNKAKQIVAHEKSVKYAHDAEGMPNYGLVMHIFEGMKHKGEKKSKQ